VVRRRSGFLVGAGISQLNRPVGAGDSVVCCLVGAGDLLLCCPVGDGCSLSRCPVGVGCLSNKIGTLRYRSEPLLFASQTRV
jgi:hypothetical protein